MEQITRRGNGYYYGGLRCDNADDAYEELRADYHAGLGRDASRRLDRIGQRTERIHGFGFCRNDASDLEDEFYDVGRIDCRMLGLVQIHYCRIVGLWDCPTMDEDRFERLVEWLFTRGSGVLRTVGKDKSGRTSKRKNTRYR